MDGFPVPILSQPELRESLVELGRITIMNIQPSIGGYGNAVFAKENIRHPVGAPCGL